MKEKKFEFRGVDFRTELLLGLCTGVIMLVVWSGLIFFYYQSENLDSILRIPKKVVTGSMFLGLTAGLTLLRIISKEYVGIWKIIYNNDGLNISFKGRIYNFQLNEIIKIIYNGGFEMRYLTFITPSNTIKIRVGTNFLMPFSTATDINTVNDFMKEITPNLKKYLLLEDKTVGLSPEGTIKLRYSKKQK